MQEVARVALTRLAAGEGYSATDFAAPSIAA
jgi:hypothetical protein